MVNNNDTEREEYSGFLIIHLRDEHIGDLGLMAELVDSKDASLYEVAEVFGLQSVFRLLDALGNPPTSPLIQSRPLSEVYALEQQVSDKEFTPFRSLINYWHLDLREYGDIEKIVAEIAYIMDDEEFRAEVDLLYPELVAYPAQVTPGDDPYFEGQGYLKAAPEGIDAVWMWSPPNNITGTGIRLVDLEAGWDENHAEFGTKSPQLHSGANSPSGVEHGTAVLAVAVGDDNQLEGIGVAPMIGLANGANKVWLVSHLRTIPNQITDAIVAVFPDMDPGDVLLLEVGWGSKPDWPAELQPDVRDAIRLASEHNIIVIEAAANANRNLNIVPALNRAHPKFEDSKAIMVGAGESGEPHDRLATSNYGSRLDCYAWGENVFTTGFPPPSQANSQDFGGTSAAAAIIAGAALLLQSMYAAQNPGQRLSPEQMRDHLSSNVGTPQGPNRAGNIGHMPNLSAIAPNLP